jgi:hypothetical protein
MRGERRPPGDDELRRLAQGARERAQLAAGIRLPGPEARSLACEVCGSVEVRWGGLCEPCRGRLRAGGRGA